jgi:tRNA(fMet)-specific endonuclease VapC
MSVSGVLLDTSVVVRHFRTPGGLSDKLDSFEAIYLPQPALAEIYAGAYRSASPGKNLEIIYRFLDAVDVILPDEETPQQYGRISAQLHRDGSPIPQNDIWIASIAMQSGLPLATLDAHFARVNGLAILHW